MFVRFELEQGATPAEVTEKHGISEPQALADGGQEAEDHPHEAACRSEAPGTGGVITSYGYGGDD